MTTFGRLALRLIDDGYQPIPVRQRSKVPAVTSWQVPPSAESLKRWLCRHVDAGVGLVGGRLVGIDIDVSDYEAAQRLADLVTAHLGPTPLIRVGRAPKTMLVYRLVGSMRTQRIALSVGKLELLAEGAFFVAFGIHPDTGQPYHWIGEDSPADTPLERLPSVTPLQLEDLGIQALKLFPANQGSEVQTASIGCTKPTSQRRQGVVRCPRTGKVLDGREAHLTQLVYDTWRTMWPATVQEIAAAAWCQFEATTDLARPAHNGKAPWRQQDAERRARSLIRKAQKGALKRIAKARGRMATPTGRSLSDREREAFRSHVLSLHQAGRLSRNDWRVSDLMLSRLRNGQCVDAAAYLARALQVSLPTVQRARRHLLIADLWDTARQLGNRESTAPYFPAPETLAKLLKSQPVQEGGVSPLIPNTVRGDGSAGGMAPSGVALVTANSRSAAEAVSAIPPQTPDSTQLALLPPAVTEDVLKRTLTEWESGTVPPIVRDSYRMLKRRRAMRQVDVAAAIRLSREQVANAMVGTFGLSAEAAARLKFWAMPEAFPLPPDLVLVGERPTRPHHRRGGRRPPDPGPMLPIPELCLFNLAGASG